jgi:hypothetical protein
MLIVVDQLEKLFAQASAEQRAAFLAALRALRAEPIDLLAQVARAQAPPSFTSVGTGRDRLRQSGRRHAMSLRARAKEGTSGPRYHASRSSGQRTGLCARNKPTVTFASSVGIGVAHHPLRRWRVVQATMLPRSKRLAFADGNLYKYRRIKRGKKDDRRKNARL